ncbi:unnamed protein product, partial [Ectocarpus fasciculatus]
SNRKCKTLVHKNCYPAAVKTIDGRSGTFVCNACERDNKSGGGVRPEDRGCVICRQTQGVESYAMVPTKEGDLVHFLCFKKAVPDAESHWKFDNAGIYVPPPGVPEALARAKAKRRCSECKRTGGVVKTCERQDCRTRFHPLCGAVLTTETQSSSEGKDWKGLGADMIIQCDKHKHKASQGALLLLLLLLSSSLLFADEPCAKCDGTDGEMVGCTRCPTYYHKACHDPPIPDDAVDNWRCATCTAALAMAGGESSEDDDDEEEEEEEEEQLQQQEEGVQEEVGVQAEQEEDDDDPEPATPGSPEHIGWLKRMQKKVRRR